MTRPFRMALVLWALLVPPAAVAYAPADPVPEATHPPSASPAEPGLLHLAQRTCRQARSCREAVVMWCNGYRRADGDNDGVPCETVCRSRAQVNEIRAEIGC